MIKIYGENNSNFSVSKKYIEISHGLLIISLFDKKNYFRILEKIDDSTFRVRKLGGSQNVEMHLLRK